MAIGAPKREGGLSQEAFDRLLLYLDADRSRAGERYEALRQKLVSFFRWRGGSSPEDDADRTIDRVAKRLQEGVELRVSDPYLYFHGVALNVLREHWREPERRHEGVAELPPSRVPTAGPAQEPDADAERQAEDRRLACLTECLDRLPGAHRRLVIEYHRAQGGAKIEARRRLAEELRISVRALRIRAYRIRRVLGTCVERCTNRSEMDSRP